MPNIMNIFEDDAFSSVALTDTLNKTPFLPSFLTQQNVFSVQGVQTKNVALQVERESYSILPFMPRGGVPPEEVLERPELYDVPTSAIGDSFTIRADQLQGVSAMPGSQAFETVDNIVMRGLARMRRNIAATYEHAYMNAIQGYWKVKGTVAQDWFAYWGQAQAAEFDFELDDTATDVLIKTEALAIAMAEDSDGMINETSEIWGVAGTSFFQQFRRHTSVKETYLSTPSAAELRVPNIWQTFSFGSLSLKHYRGSPDGSSIVVPATKAYFYPTNSAMFKVFHAPHPAFDTINTVGIPLYVVSLPDTSGRNMYRRFEVYTYPLIACMQPAALRTGKAA